MSEFNETWIFSKYAQISSFMKLGPVEAETDTRTDLKKLIVAFRNLRTRLINAQSLQKVTPCTSSDGW